MGIEPTALLGLLLRRPALTSRSACQPRRTYPQPTSNLQPPGLGRRLLVAGSNSEEQQQFT